jgi:hypothetical protein
MELVIHHRLPQAKVLLEAAQLLEIQTEHKLEQVEEEQELQEVMLFVQQHHLHLLETEEQEKFLAFLELMFSMQAEAEAEELKIQILDAEVSVEAETEAMYRGVELHQELQELLIPVEEEAEQWELLRDLAEVQELLSYVIQSK